MQNISYYLSRDIHGKQMFGAVIYGEPFPESRAIAEQQLLDVMALLHTAILSDWDLKDELDKNPNVLQFIQNCGFDSLIKEGTHKGLVRPNEEKPAARRRDHIANDFYAVEATYPIPRDVVKSLAEKLDIEIHDGKYAAKHAAETVFTEQETAQGIGAKR